MKRFITIIFVAIFFLLLIGMFAQNIKKQVALIIKIEVIHPKDVELVKAEIKNVLNKYKVKLIELQKINLSQDD